MSSKFESPDCSKEGKAPESTTHIVDLAKPVTENSPFSKAPDPKDIEKLAGQGFTLNKFSVSDDIPPVQPNNMKEPETRVPKCPDKDFLPKCSVEDLKPAPNGTPGIDRPKEDETMPKGKPVGMPDAKFPEDPICVYFPDTGRNKMPDARDILNPPDFKDLKNPGKVDSRSLKEKFEPLANSGKIDPRSIKDVWGDVPNPGKFDPRSIKDIWGPIPNPGKFDARSIKDIWGPVPNPGTIKF